VLKRLLSILLLIIAAIALTSCNDRQPLNDLDSINTNPQVEVTTNHGTFIIELYPDQAPATVNNFLQYAEEGYYDNTIIHRVIKDFIIEAGGYTDTFERRQPKAPIKNESQPGSNHLRGTVAMARHAHPDSANSRFFINLTDNPVFDIRNGYTVFGRVIQGMDIVDGIGNTKTGPRGPFPEHAPIEHVYIEKITVLAANNPTTTQLD
jgi:cyclophilin family peptidyl-prolyl cis-trans isomerase